MRPLFARSYIPNLPICCVYILVTSIRVGFGHPCSFRVTLLSIWMISLKLCRFGADLCSDCLDFGSCFHMDSILVPPIPFAPWNGALFQSNTTKIEFMVQITFVWFFPYNIVLVIPNNDVVTKDQATPIGQSWLMLINQTKPNQMKPMQNKLYSLALRSNRNITS
jgi:hypothetical protein